MKQFVLLIERSKKLEDVVHTALRAIDVGLEVVKSYALAKRSLIEKRPVVILCPFSLPDAQEGGPQTLSRATGSPRAFKDTTDHVCRRS